MDAPMEIVAALAGVYAGVAIGYAIGHAIGAIGHALFKLNDPSIKISS